MLSQVSVGFYNALKLYPETWVTATAYALGDLVKPTTYASHSYKCTTAGTSGASEPTWGTTNGGTTADGTGALVWTCYDTKTYNTKSPQGSTVPYVTFGLETDVPIGTFAGQVAIESLTYWVNCFDSVSAAAVAEIADEVMTAMDDVSLTVTGYTSMKCVREFMGTIIYDLETGIFQCPLRYRVWADKT